MIKLLIIRAKHFRTLYNLGYFKDLKATVIRHFNPKQEKMEYIRYLNIYAGFDIETTTIDDLSFMYHWQFSFFTDEKEIVICGREWRELEDLIKEIKSIFGLSYNLRILIWIANTSYEFSFMFKRFKWSEIFAKETRQPLIARTGGIEFRECLTISGSNLAHLAKTYCETQKLTGDLDFKIIRNKYTKLTNTEKYYCWNDVIILAEFSKYIFDNFMRSQNYIPLTKTHIIRHNMKKYAKSLHPKEEYKELKEWIASLFPKSSEEYKFIMNYLFRGGYVHGDFMHILELLFNLDSFDKKSSYPWSILTKYVPMSPWKEVKKPTKQKYLNAIKNKCVIAVIEFRGLKSKTNHSLESKSKCISLEGALIDNGRVHKADKMTVIICELDFQNYEKWYEFNDFKVLQMHISERGYLPNYLRDGLYFAFKAKEEIDKFNNPREYTLQKEIVNSYYGMCVTRLPFNDVFLINNEWIVQESKKSYDELRANEILSPFWGIYICAHSRKSECDFIIENANSIFYGDTDSGKGYLNSSVAKWLHNFNKENTRINREFAKRWAYDPDVIKHLGNFEWETSPKELGKIYWFKYGGAKRYISQYANEGFKSTIAGLPKKSLNEFCISEGINPFEYFNKDMEIPESATHKLRAKYIDNEYECYIEDAEGNGELMHELSGVCLLPVNFTMSFDKDWLKMLAFHLDRFKRFG